MDDNKYIEKMKEDLILHEALCKRCGVCCGITTSDPCSNLSKEEDGRCRCLKYDTRFGVQTSRSGRTFMCVAIRDVLKYGILHTECGYSKKR